MNMKNEGVQNRTYIKPQIRKIKLDNEISLVMESTPPEGPGETFSSVPDYIDIDPFKTDFA